jgi:LPS-assembly protein
MYNGLSLNKDILLRTMPAVRFFYLCPLLCLLGNTTALAQEYVGMPTAPASRETTDVLCDPAAFPVVPVIPELAGEETHLQADQADISREQVSVFRGNVVIQRGKAQLEADQANYHYLDETLDAEGNVRFSGAGLLITGSDAHADLKNNTASFNNARYYTSERANGTARTISLLDPYRLVLDDATYTTCEPEDPDWLMSASQVRLDRESQQGTAKHMVLRFNRVPFLYFPYVRFPISEERLSGFLNPTIGSSNKLGAQFKLPYYWNIAPNYDATFTPWYMHKRGTMLQTEFRYLHSINQGQLDVHYLPKDKGFLDEDRSAVRWQHAGQPFKNWVTHVDYSRISDTDYLLDFGNSLNATSTTHLDQQGDVTYEASNWLFKANAQAYQTISGSIPYERLPQLLFQSHLPQLDNRLHYGLDGEWVSFTHDNDIVQGDRLDIFPSVSFPLRNEAAFFIPKLAYRYTQYELEDVAPGADPSPSRSLPTVSLDSGLFFDRDTQIGSTALQQTLEPRLYYVYTPYREQDDLPIFDTQQSRFNINEPIKADFFDGADRVEDANRLTALLATRYISQNSGAELFMAGIGQVYYFDDRLVSLPAGSPQTQARSNIVATITTRPSGNWLFHYDTEWNTQTEQFDRNSAELVYDRQKKLKLKLAYRFERTVLETAEAGFDWQLNPRWRLHGSEIYDLFNERNQEAELGLRYDSCCWGVALSVKERFVTDTEPQDTSFFLELELKGLSSISTGF